ncbi:selenide, water dikinase SelD [Acidobacteria bacterium ACD]|nr:selenide, water dikinase SelD [Acidobacteria bacterium ACD]
MAESPIYLDTNATTPVDPEVAEAMLPYLTTHFGNPSSGHAFGTRARAAVEEARRQVASFLGGRPEEVVFTSGGTEGINTVVQGVARALRGRGRHVVTTAVEHPAVLEPCAALEAEGFRVTRVGVDAEGRVDPRDVAAAIGPETILVSVMHANNEVGTLQPVGEIARIARERGVLVHTDAAQSAGKVPVDVAALGVDFLTLAGHKLYAPKGVGALWIRSSVSLPRLLHGASHEGGRRAGTENVLEIVGLGKACEVAARRLATDAPRMEALRERLFEGLSREFPDLRRNSPREGCLPNTLSVGFRGLEASTLLAEVGDRVAASAGAACHAAGVDVSTVLTAMKVPLEYAMGTVRFSVGRWTTEAEVDEAVQIVSEAVRRLSPVTAAAAAPVEEAGPVRLTRYTHGMGCACKLRPQDLETVLRSLPRSADPAVLVGPETSDDAAVYRLTPYLAIVSTVDFFTPIADDPFDFGAVSAANSLSDVYAMGGKPLFALSVVGFPARRLPLRVLDRILAGAAEVASEAGIPILGGHTVDDTEPKFGLAVTGVVHPDRILTNAAARAGDALVLTKPLGTGILATAVKRGLAGEEVARRIVAVMRRLNRAAAESTYEVGVSAATDVTGFGLLGHLREMAAASGLDAEVEAASVPVIDPAREMAASDAVPGGTLENLAHVSPHVDFAPGLSRVEKLLLADAQTSGGLLIAVPEERSDALLASLREKGVHDARRIGRFTGPGTGRIRVD